MTGERGELGSQLRAAQLKADAEAQIACRFLVDGQQQLALEMALQHRATMDRVQAIREQIRALA